MKQLFWGLIFLTVAKCGWSQIQRKPYFTMTEADSAFFKSHHFAPFNNRIQLVGPLKSSFSDSLQPGYLVAGGKFFSLPQDNMPCLQPDTSIVYNMPVKIDGRNGNMPNGYRPNNNGLIILKKKY